MKRIITLLFAAMLAGQAWAQDFTIGNLKYTITGTNTVSVGYTGTKPSGALTIESEVENDGVKYFVTGITDAGFRNCSDVTSVTIPEGVTRIGKKAFDNCYNMLSISMPSTMTSIGSYSFHNCARLKGTLTIPNSVTIIEDSAFYDCANFTAIEMTNVVSIGDHAFCGCEKVKSIVIPSSVTNIGDCAFSKFDNTWNSIIIGDGCDVDFDDKSLYFEKDGFKYCVMTKNTIRCTGSVDKECAGSLVLPPTVTVGNTFTVVKIENGAFWENPNLTSFTIPNTVTYIGYMAFYHCSGLTTINIPSSVTTISSNNTFGGCTSLSSVTIESDINFSDNNISLPIIKDGIRYKVLDKNTVAVVSNSYSGSVIIPASISAGNNFAVTSIADYAFNDRENLMSVAIPNSVTSIGTNVFLRSSNMTAYCEFESRPASWSYNWIPSTTKVVWGAIFKGDYILLQTSGTEHTVEVARYGGSATTITIPESFEIDGVQYSVNKIGDNAFKKRTDLTSITIPKSVTEISPSAFTGCSATLNFHEDSDFLFDDGVLFNKDKTILISCCKPLTSYSIPTTVKTIKSFSSPGLTSISIPSSVENVDSAAFFGCNKLTSITINSQADFSKADLCFQKNNLNYEVLTEDNVMVGSYNDRATGNVIIPETVTCGNSFTVIGIDSHFCPGDSRIISVLIPNTVTFINNAAFNSCYGLKSINIPKSVTKIGSRAFYCCEKISSVTIESDADFSKSDLQFIKDGIYYDVLSKNTVEVANKHRSSDTELYKGDVVIPEKVNVGSEFSVVGIAVSAFNYSEGLTSVTIPNSVKSIGANAFEGCKNMTSVDIPSSVTTIGENAFKRSGLTSFTVPQGVTDIYVGTFNDCTGLKSVTIHKSVKSIFSNAFDGCNNIETLTYNTDAIETCFSGKTKLKTVNIGSSVTSIGRSTFEDCTGLTSITLPDGITSIGDQAFKNCSGLTSITLPDGITSIGDQAFKNCSGLVSLEIPEGVTTIGSSAFERCSGLKSVTIPQSVTDIGIFAFEGCTGIETLTYNTNAILSRFSSIKSLKTVNIGNSVTNISNWAFQNTGLTSITISNSVKSIGSRVFYNCTALESITIPNSVTEIGGEAFMGCTGLKSIIVSDSLKKIEHNAFNKCSALTSIVIPKSTATVGSNAFISCDNLTIYCKAESQPKGWASNWNPDNRPVIWGGNADAYPADNFTFEIIDNESLTAKITGYTGTNPNVIIPQKAKINGKDYTVTTIGKRVFDSNSTLRSVFIPHTISNVESLAFGRNHYEAKIFCEAAGDDNTVPAGWASNWYGTSVPAIAYNAHIDNGFVYQITDKSARKAQIIRYMGENDTVSVPEKINGGTYTINSIDGYAFYECNALKAIDIPSSVTEIGNYAFYGSKIESLTLNSNAIGTNFQNSPSLKTVHLGSNVTSLPDRAFSHSGLEEITFSESVKTVGSNAFEDCSKLKKTDFASIESLCAIEFDIYESNPMEISHSLYVNGEEIVDVYIPGSVSSIGNRAFSGCSNLTSVSIPKSVTSIGEKAFQNCSNLTVFCEAKSQPEGWNEKWNPDDRPVVWGLYTDKKIWQATITPNSSEYGTVVGGGYVIDSTVTTITATPNAGYHFAGWSDKNTDNQRVIEVTSDTLLTALFEAHKVVVDSAVAATCTEPGLTEGSHCSVCGVVLVEQDTIPAKGHTIVIDEAVEPTCTETGLGEGKHCAVCDEYDWTQELLPALGHEFVNYIYNNDATTEADGTETAVCERGCGATDTRIAEGTKLATAISESVAGNLEVHAHGNVIIVENATDEIRVYDAMGRMIGRDAINRVRTEIRVNTPGVYLVKVGNVAKRVMVSE